MSWEKKNTKGYTNQIHRPSADVLFTRPNDARIHEGKFIEFDAQSGLYLISIGKSEMTHVDPTRIICWA